MTPADRPPHDTPGLPPAVAPAPTRFETRLAAAMTAAGFLHLLAVAGLVHRAQHPTATPLEIRTIYGTLVGLWAVIALEAAVGVARRDRARPLRPVLWRAVRVCLLPPMRMATPSPRTGLTWVPRLGWRPPGHELYRSLERAFGPPMIAFAFLILPILTLEYVAAEEVKAHPGLALALHIGVAVIWVAFAVEFVYQSSAHPKPVVYLRERWLDVAIVAFPMAEFVLTRWVDAAPLARLLRLGRALTPEQLARMQQVYRLRGVVAKAWRAFLVFGGLARLIRRPEKRLRQLEDEIAALEEELAGRRAEAEELRRQIATRRAE